MKPLGDPYHVLFTDLREETYPRSDMNANNLHTWREVEDQSRWWASICSSFKENSRDQDVRESRERRPHRRMHTGEKANKCYKVSI